MVIFHSYVKLPEGIYYVWSEVDFQMGNHATSSVWHALGCHFPGHGERGWDGFSTSCGWMEGFGRIARRLGFEEALWSRWERRACGGWSSSTVGFHSSSGIGSCSRPLTCDHLRQDLASSDVLEVLARWPGPALDKKPEGFPESGLNYALVQASWTALIGVKWH